MHKNDGKDSNVSLSKRIALVTGGAHRVGAAIARELHSAGMNVAISFNRSRGAADELMTKLNTQRPGSCFVFQSDLGEEGAGRKLVETVNEVAGPIHLLVASAANFEHVAFEDIDRGHLERTMALNTFASVEMAQAARESLAASNGNVVLISGYGVKRPYLGYLPYLLSKYAADGLCRALAMELAPEIRVNAVAPGTVIPPPDYSAEQVGALLAKIPLQKVGSGEAVAEAVRYLASASYVTGQTLYVDGGRTIA